MSTTPQTVKAGAVVKDSGAYRNEAGRTVTLIRDKRAPPIKGGGVWTQVFDTNEKDASTKRHEKEAVVIHTPQPSEPSPFDRAKEIVKDVAAEFRKI